MAENIIEIANEDELPPAPETNKVTIADDKEVVPLKKKELTEPTTTSLGGVSFPLSDILAKNKQVKADLGITEPKQTLPTPPKSSDYAFGKPPQLTFDNKAKEDIIKVDEKKNLIKSTLINISDRRKSILEQANELQQEIKPLVEEYNVLNADYEQTRNPEAAKRINELTPQLEGADVQIKELEKKYSEDGNRLEILNKGYNAYKNKDAKSYDNPFVAIINNSANKIAEGLGTILEQASLASVDPETMLLRVSDKITGNETAQKDFISNALNFAGKALQESAEQNRTQVNPIYTEDVFKNPNLANIGYQLSSSVADMSAVAAMYALNPAAGALTSYTQSVGDLHQSAKEAGLDDNTANIFALGTGAIVSALDVYGIDKVMEGFTKKSLIKELSKKALPELINKEVTQEVFDKVISKSLIDVGKDIASGAIKPMTTELFTGAGQELATIGGERLANEIAGEQKFNEEDIGKRLIQGGISEAVAGGIISGSLSAKNAIYSDKNIYKNLVSNISDPEDSKIFNEILDKKLETNEISQEEFDNVKTNVAKLKEFEAKIPNQIIDVDKRFDAVNLVAEKENIAKDIEGKDEALIEPQKQRIIQINEELKQIANPQAKIEGANINTIANENQNRSIQENANEKNVGQGYGQNEKRREGESKTSSVLQDEKGRESLLKQSEQVAEPVSPVSNPIDAISDIQLSNGNKLILNKDRSVKAGKNFAFDENSYDIQDKDGNNVGSIHVSDRGNYYQISNVKIKNERTGLGTEMYKSIISKLDKPLVSDKALSEKAKGLWNKLVKEGFAEKFNDITKIGDKSYSEERYRAISPVAIPLADAEQPKAGSVGVGVLKIENKTKDILDEVTDEKIGEKKYQDFSIDFEDGARAFGTIENGVANISGINAPKKEDSVIEPKRGTKTYERVIEKLKENGIKTIKVSLQSQDSQAALSKLVEKGILSNPRDMKGVSDSQFATTFDIQSLKETPKASSITESEKLKQELDKEIEIAKQKLRKAASGSLSSGGLQAIPEFVNLVKLYYKKGQYEVDEFISIAKTFFGDKFTEKQIKDAHDKIISEEIKTNEKLKQKVEDVKYEQGFKTELEKEKSAKKIEALKQKIKTQKDNLSLAKQTVKDYIDTNRKELGGATDSELIGSIKKANDATTINQVEKIINAIDKVTGSVEYYNKVRSANSTVKGIKKLIKEKNKKINLSVTDKEVAKRLIGINPKMLSTEKLLNDFNDLAEKMLTGIARPKVKETKKAGITAENVGREYSNADAENAIIEFEKDIEKTKQNNFNKKIKKFIDELNLINISTKNLTDAEIEDLYKDTIAPKEDREVDNKEVKEEFLRDVVADKVDDFIINDLPNIQGATIDEERHLNNIAKVNVADLDYDQLGVLSNVIDNIVYNNDYAGAGRVTTIIEGTQNAKETTKYLKSLNTKIRDFANSTLNKKIRIGKDIPAKMRRLVFGDAKILADMKYKMGWARLENANAQNVKSVGEFEKTIDDASRDALKNGIDIKTAENTIKAGIFSTLDMTSDDPNISEQSFSELKEQIKQSYELMKAHSEDKKIQKMGEQTESIYKNWDLDNIKTIEEFRDKLEKGSKADIEVVKAVKKIQKAHEKIEPLLAESTENYSNNRWVSENNYTALVKKSIKNKYDADKLTTVPNIFGASSGVNKTKSSTTISRTNKLGKDQYIDMDFYRNQLDKFKQSSIDAHTLKERMVLDNMLKNKEFREDVGNNIADGLRKLAIDKVNSMMGIQEQTSESGKYAEKVANAWTNFGVRRVLFGMTQVPKQSVVMVNTISQLGGAVKGLTEVIKAFKNTKGWDDFKMKYPISIRSSVESGTKRGLQMSESDRTNFNKQWNDFKEMLAKNKVTYNFKELADIKDNFQKSFLVGTDVAMAEASWRAYYTKYVKENEGRDVTDWTTEKGNDQAASYANEMINKFQNISDQTDASNMAKERGWGRLAYDVFAPLSSFAMAARYRMSDSANAIASKGVSSDTKKQAYKDLIGTAQEMAIYGIVATAITQLIMIPSANALLKSMDMEEIEDPKSFIEKWYERFFKDALLGGTTAIGEKTVPWLIDSSIRFMNEKNYQQDIHNMNNAIGAWERAQQVTSVPFTKERKEQEEKKIYDLQSIVNDEKKYRPLGTAPVLDMGSGKFDLRTTQSMLSMFEFAREIYNSDEAKRIEKDFKQLDAERQAKLSTEQSPTKDAIITQHEINNLWKALSIEAAIFVIGGADMTNIISRANKEQMKQLKYKYYGSENYNKRIIGTGFYTRKQSEADKRANIEAAKRR